MKPVSVSINSPLRTAARHGAAAVVAVVGAITLQIAWPAVFSGDRQKSPWLLAALLNAATGYLLATAWFHATTARGRPNDLGPRLGRLGRGLACDLILGCASGAALAGGHTTTLFRAGLWIVPPTLLAVCSASALVEVLALRDQRSPLASSHPPASAPLPLDRSELLRLIFAVLLAALLFALG